MITFLPATEGQATQKFGTHIHKFSNGSYPRTIHKTMFCRTFISPPPPPRILAVVLTF